jgi:hypothetical protein
MKRVTWLVVSVLLFLAGSSAHAQGTYVRPQTNPYGTPAVSPYLNLTRPGPPGINYFNLVQPQMQAFNQLQQLEATTQQTAAVLQADAMNQNRLVTDTGHQTRFMSFSQYFQNTGGQHPTAPATTPAVFAPAAATLNRGGR